MSNYERKLLGDKDSESTLNSTNNSEKLTDKQMTENIFQFVLDNYSKYQESQQQESE